MTKCWVGRDASERLALLSSEGEFKNQHRNDGDESECHPNRYDCAYEFLCFSNWHFRPLQQISKPRTPEARNSPSVIFCGLFMHDDYADQGGLEAAGCCSLKS